MNWLEVSEEEREAKAEELLDQLTPVMSVLGILFLIVIIGERMATGTAQSIFQAVAWSLWIIFIAEFLLRVIIAPHTMQFLRKNWWQVLFLVLPVLRILRIARAMRLLRSTRVVSGAVRSTRSARVIFDRLLWLTIVTAIVVVASAELLFEYGEFDSFAAALHRATVAAIAGEELGQTGPVVSIIEVGLLIYSVAIVATLAGTIGAYFLQHEGEKKGKALENQKGPRRDLFE
jgi:voltage-gated potassium channel